MLSFICFIISNEMNIWNNFYMVLESSINDFDGEIDLNYQPYLAGINQADLQTFSNLSSMYITFHKSQ